MCAPHPIDPATANIRPPALAPIETAVPPEEEATTEHTEDALAALADEMHAKCEELFGGARLGQWAAALLIDSYADRIERALGIQPKPKTDRRTDGQTAGPADGGNALDACGYRVLKDEPFVFDMALETPFEGAGIRAMLSTYEDREHYGSVFVRNARGLGWDIGVFFHDMGRFVAKKLLRTLAIEVRKAYCHRGQKIRKRAIARAIARRQAAETAGPSDRQTLRPSDRPTAVEAAHA